MGGGATELSPSAIHYTQDSIKNTFTKPDGHEDDCIGYTLDDLCEGHFQVTDIPRIEVFESNGRWWSADNRRLWVFRQFQRLGGCDKVNVKVVGMNRVDRRKFTTVNGGDEVRIRGSPGGVWYKRADDSLGRGFNRSHDGHKLLPAGRQRGQNFKDERMFTDENNDRYNVDDNCDHDHDDPGIYHGPRPSGVHSPATRPESDEWFTRKNIFRILVLGAAAFYLFKKLSGSRHESNISHCSSRVHCQLPTHFRNSHWAMDLVL